MKKISLIIPVYNVEKYVEKCIVSCINQDLKKEDYEIIVINDGSTDNSFNIVQNLKSQYDELIIFSQDNMGLSAARNKGLSLAMGEYVWFIDSDDWIRENCLNEIVSKLAHIDVLTMGYVRVFDDSKNEIITNVSDYSCCAGVEVLSNGYSIPAQFYIYRKNFLECHNLSFAVGLFHEDFEFTPRMLYLAQKVSSYVVPVYFYLQRSNSITTTNNPKRSFDLLQIASNLLLFKNEVVHKKHKYIFSNIIGLGINNAMYNALNISENEQKHFEDALSKNTDILKELKFATIFKYKLQGYLYALLPKQAFLIYKFLKKLV